MKLIKNLMIRAHIYLLTTESARAGVFAAGAAVGAGLFMVSDPASATGFGAWGTNLKNELGGVVQGGLYAAYAGGLAITGLGLNRAMEKSKNENSQITTGSIAAQLIGGPALMTLTYIADTMAESVGGSQATSQMNRY
jgi:hypothetical protein